MDSKKITKTILVSVVAIVVIVGAGYVLLRLTGIIDPDACTSKEMNAIPNLSGAKIEIVYTNCDTLVKDEAISVYISRSGIAGDSWLAKWTNRKSLIFRYDPGPDRHPPEVEGSGEGRLSISVSEVSWVIFQSRKWRNISIEYKIGRDMNP